jgi:hypothetical protein
VGGPVLANFDGKQWQRITNVTGLPPALDLYSVWIDADVAPPRLFLAGRGLLADCTIGGGNPLAVKCTSFPR